MQDPRELIERIEALIELMMNVAAGRDTIRDKERQYVAAWKDINGDVRRVPGDQQVRHPNGFASLYEWQEVYETLNRHIDMYAYLRDLYRPMIRALEAAPTPEMVEADREGRPSEAAPRFTNDEQQQREAAAEHMERQLEEMENPRYVNVVTDILPIPKEPSRGRLVGAYLYEHYIKAIIIAVCAGLITLLILAALGIHPA